MESFTSVPPFCRSLAYRQRSHAYLQQQQDAQPWQDLKVLDLEEPIGGASHMQDDSIEESNGLRTSSLREFKCLRDLLQKDAESARAAKDEDDNLGMGSPTYTLSPVEYLGRVAGMSEAWGGSGGTGSAKVKASSPTPSPPVVEQVKADIMGKSRHCEILESLERVGREGEPKELRAAHDVIRGRILGALVGEEVLSSEKLFMRVGAAGQAQKDLTLRLVKGLAHLLHGNWVSARCVDEPCPRDCCRCFRCLPLSGSLWY